MIPLKDLLPLVLITVLLIAAAVLGVTSLVYDPDQQGYEIGVCTVHTYQADPDRTEQQARALCEDETFRDLILDQPIRPEPRTDA